MLGMDASNFVPDYEVAILAELLNTTVEDLLYIEK